MEENKRLTEEFEGLKLKKKQKHNIPSSLSSPLPSLFSLCREFQKEEKKFKNKNIKRSRVDSESHEAQKIQNEMSVSVFLKLFLFFVRERECVCV